MNNKSETLEIDLNEYPKNLLIRLIIAAHESNSTFNDVIVKILTDYLPKLNSEDENQLPLL